MTLKEFLNFLHREFNKRNATFRDCVFELVLTEIQTSRVIGKEVMKQFAFNGQDKEYNEVIKSLNTVCKKAVKDSGKCMLRIAYKDGLNGDGSTIGYFDCTKDVMSGILSTDRDWCGVAIRTLDRLGRQYESFARRRGLRRDERIEGRADDRELGYALDDVCRKHAEVGFASIDELRRVLKDIERGANKLGCSFTLQMMDNGRRYREQDVDTFCDGIGKYLDDDTFLELTFMDGEPGDNYMLTFNDYDGRIEECADLVFTPSRHI